MRVLVITGETPAHPASGGPSRQYNLLEPLASRHVIRVLSTGGTPPSGATPAGVEIALVPPAPYPAAPPGWLLKNVRHVICGPPWHYHYGARYWQSLVAEMPRQIAAFRPDVVQVEHGHMAPILACLPASVASILVMHNLMTTIHAQAARQGGLRGRLGALAETVVMARQERRDLGGAHIIVVVTEADRKRAQRLRPGARVEVVPNCIDVAYHARTEATGPGPAIFFGANYNWAPNQAAARDLVADILPRVRQRRPDARLVLAGQGMPEDLVALAAATPGADALGALADVRPALQQAWVVAAPLRQGSGSPLKIMEAMAAGVPAVTTPRVLASLGLQPGDGVLEAESNADFAARIGELLGDAGLRSELGARGRSLAAERFDRGPAALLQERSWVDAVEAAGAAVAG